MNIAKILLLQIISTIALTERTTVVKITLSLCYTTWRTRKWRKFYTLTTSLPMTPLGLPEVLLDRSFVVIFTLKYCVLVFYKKNLLEGRWSLAEVFFKHSYCHASHLSFFRLLSSPVLLRKFTRVVNSCHVTLLSVWGGALRDEAKNSYITRQVTRETLESD